MTSKEFEKAKWLDKRIKELKELNIDIAEKRINDMSGDSVGVRDVLDKVTWESHVKIKQYALEVAKNELSELELEFKQLID